MNILAFDTGLNKTYIALYTNGNIFSEVIESTKDKYHSAFLIQKIVEILTLQNLRPNEIDLFATNVGPGSFTGIRVGLTVARGLAQGTGADTTCVNSLELISYAYGLPSITVIDARKNKAYVGNDKNIELMDLENLPGFLKNFKGKIISDTKMQEFLTNNGIDSINFEKESMDYGKILINLSLEKIKQNAITKWHGLKPLYIQPPPIHIKSK